MKFSTTSIALTALASTASALSTGHSHGHAAAHKRAAEREAKVKRAQEINARWNSPEKRQEGGTFGVLHFVNEEGRFGGMARMDPIVSPGKEASHAHGIMGGSAFGLTVEGDQLLHSNCTSSKVNNDKSNYWVPQLFFESPTDGTFQEVPLYYMNVYYFFEATDDTIEPFPPGLKIVSGDKNMREPPWQADLNLDPSLGDIQPVQWTCPTQSGGPVCPEGSDGSSACMSPEGNQGVSVGFPVVDCDGTYSPLRQDIHMPSCYNPEAGIEDYENNMAFPEGGNCPEGWTHVPHMFYEVYYNTPLFADQWTPDGQTQPFVLANGDRTGYSSHADFISGWDEETLRQIIQNCNVEHEGLEYCPGLIGGMNEFNACPLDTEFTHSSEPMDKLPGDNPLSGWGI